MEYNDGFLHGTGAAFNVELGWIPSYVRIVNLTDGDQIYEGPIATVIGFDSGSVEPKAGDTIEGATSGAVAIVQQVILDSGSWAGGDAAGWLVLENGSLTGTPADDETVGINDSGTDDLTFNGAVADIGIGIAADVAVATGDATVTAYLGTSGARSKGFTMGSTISGDAKLLYYQAWAPGDGAGAIDQT